LLSINAGTARAHLRHNSCAPDMPLQSLIGVGGDGLFKTSSAKEYPSRMCRALALAAIDCTAALDTDSTELCADPDWVATVQKWAADLEECRDHSMGADFAGNNVSDP